MSYQTKGRISAVKFDLCNNCVSFQIEPESEFSIQEKEENGTQKTWIVLKKEDDSTAYRAEALLVSQSTFFILSNICMWADWQMLNLVNLQVDIKGLENSSKIPGQKEGFSIRVSSITFHK